MPEGGQHAAWTREVCVCLMCPCEAMIPVSSMPCHHHSLRLAVGYALPLIALDPSATILAYLQILWSTAAVDTFQGRQKFMIKWLQQDLLYQDNPLCKQTPHGTIRLNLGLNSGVDQLTMMYVARNQSIMIYIAHRALLLYT
ncbi:TPA: hypothetical protein ACH3X2_004842 [Trebouxia sp. C0005]